MNSSRISQLPSEIVEVVVDNLDTQDLASFRLLCRDLYSKSLRTAAPRLFSTFSTNLVGDDLRMLHELAQHTYLRECVQEINIVDKTRLGRSKPGCIHLRQEYDEVMKRETFEGACDLREMIQNGVINPKIIRVRDSVCEIGNEKRFKFSQCDGDELAVEILGGTTVAISWEVAPDWKLAPGGKWFYEEQDICFFLSTPQKGDLDLHLSSYANKIFSNLSSFIKITFHNYFPSKPLLKKFCSSHSQLCRIRQITVEIPISVNNIYNILTRVWSSEDLSDLSFRYVELGNLPGWELFFTMALSQLQYDVRFSVDIFLEAGKPIYLLCQGLAEETKTMNLAELGTKFSLVVTKEEEQLYHFENAHRDFLGAILKTLVTSKFIYT